MSDIYKRMERVLIAAGHSETEALALTSKLIDVLLPEGRDKPEHTDHSAGEYRLLADYIDLHRRTHKDCLYLGVSEYSWRLISSALEIAVKASLPTPEGRAS